MPQLRGRGPTGIEWGEGSDTPAHSAMCLLLQRMNWPNMSKVLRWSNADLHHQVHLSQAASSPDTCRLSPLLRHSKAKIPQNQESEGGRRNTAPFLLFIFYWKFTNVLQTSVKHHIHFTGDGSQAKCSQQSLAEPTPKACHRPS